MAKKKVARKPASKKRPAKKRKVHVRKAKALPRTVTAQAADRPPVGQLWKGQGGWNMGECLGENGKSNYHLILVAGPDGKPLTIESTYGAYVDVPGANSYRDGAAVTDALVAADNKLACASREVTTTDGQKDCSLAAQCEMNIVRANGGHLLPNGYYWCGTQHDRDDAWCQGFHYGCQDICGKYGSYRVFFVRRVYIETR